MLLQFTVCPALVTLDKRELVLKPTATFCNHLPCGLKLDWRLEWVKCWYNGPLKDVVNTDGHFSFSSTQWGHMGFWKDDFWGYWSLFSSMNVHSFFLHYHPIYWRNTPSLFWLESLASKVTLHTSGHSGDYLLCQAPTVLRGVGVLANVQSHLGQEITL